MLYAIIAALVLVADQWLKYWVTINITLATGEIGLIPHVVKLVNIHNSGAAFGLLDKFAYARWIFLGIAVIFVVAVIVLLAKRVFSSRFANWCMVLAMAGAVGNCIDRLLYGYVVDMFKLEFMDFAIFNVADIVLVVSCILFIIALFTTERDEEYEDEDEDEEYEDEPEDNGDIAVEEIESTEAEVEDEPETLVHNGSAGSIEDMWAAFKSELHSKPAAAPAEKSKPAPTPVAKPKPAPTPVAKPKPAPAPKKAPAADEYDLESILAEFKDI